LKRKKGKPGEVIEVSEEEIQIYGSLETLGLGYQR